MALFETAMLFDNRVTLYDSLFQAGMEFPAKFAVQTTLSPRLMMDRPSSQTDELLKIMDGMLYNLLRTGIRPFMNNNLYITVPTVSSFADPNEWAGKKLIMRMDVDTVVDKPVIYKFIEEKAAIPSDVHKCKWCDGWTKNDMRGNCCCCGAPRTNL